MQRRFTLLILAFLTMVLGLSTVLRSEDTHHVSAAICFNDAPLGAIDPATPEWCQSQPLPAGIDTHQESANAWLDDFNHGQSHAGLSAAYLSGRANDGEGSDHIHFQHADHWMVDCQGDNGQWPGYCIAWMRPDRTFTMPASGPLVIEFEVASPIAGTRDVGGLSDAWPEFTLTADPAPGRLRANGTYLYETFAGFWAFGCRMQQSRHPICALYEPADGFAGGPTRQWEINQNGGEVTDQFGGDPSTPGLADVWKACTNVDDPDVICRNKFRWEITASRVKLFVNGVRYYEAGLIDTQLGNILNAPGGFHVYFGDFAYRISQDVVVRFHWDRLAVNPSLLDSSPTPTSTPTPTLPAPTATFTPTPTVSTPTSTATATSIPTATPTASTQKQCRQDIFERRANGSYVRVSRVFYSAGDCISGQP